MGDGAAHGLDPARIAFAGDSAGATLALYAGAELKHTGAVRALALVYGVYWVDVDTPSWRAIGNGAYGLTVKQMQWIWDGYLDGQDVDPKDPRLAPLYADLSGLAPTWVMVGDLDPLIDDNRALVERLEAAGVAHTFKIEEGVTHFFWMWQRLYARSRASIAEGGAFLKQHLRG
ncbi:MAG: alpha/beta hydrolase fold domain-containing protein [Alphaproteobacteria bacterium]|nr:alpha/beta hydrolase fold domain-containing protein [Alphaproteobacteria bacterium]